MPNTNQSRCNCQNFGIFLRILCMVTYLGLATASAWGYLIANKYFRLGKNTLLFDLTAETMGVYLGLMATYYIIFSFFGFFAELRNKFVLRYFGFLRTHLGRGSFMFFLGSTFVVIPWDEEKPYVSKVPGSFQLACGISHIIYSMCVVSSDDGDDEEEYNGTPTKTSKQKKGKNSSTSSTLSPGQAIAWGSTEDNNNTTDNENNAPKDEESMTTTTNSINISRDFYPSTPTSSKDTSKTQLVGNDANNTTNVIKNPFAAAMGK